jgi:MFS superfamily sulfate permease-like transporter
MTEDLPDLPANQTNFFAELKRRNVYKVALAYCAIAWLLIEMGEIGFPIIEAADWLITAFVCVIGVGFLIALYIAWAFEMTPHGMKRTENVLPDEHIPQWSRKKYATLIGAVAAMAFVLSIIHFWHTH